MLSRVLKSRGRIHALRDDFTGTLFESFGQALSETGYATDTARRYIRAAEHFINWTHQRGMPVQEVNDQSLMEFNRHLGRCRCPHYDREDHVNVDVTGFSCTSKMGENSPEKRKPDHASQEV